MYKVIIVDDEPPFIRSITRMVNRYCSEFEVVDFAYNGKEALEKLATLDIDVLITDIKMPVIDGIKLLKTVHYKYPHIQTVIVSGYQDFEYAKAALKIGVIDYLLKPIDKSQFTEVMNKISEELKRKFEVIENRILYDILNGNQIGNILAEKYLGFAYFRVLLVLQGVYLNLTNRLFYNSDLPLKKLIESSLSESECPDKKWVIEISRGKQYLLILAYNSMPQNSDDIMHCYKRLKTVVPYINLAYSQTFSNLGELKKTADKLDACLKNNISIGNSNIFSLTDEQNTGIKLYPYLDGVTLSKFDVLIGSKSHELLFKEIEKLQNVWEKEKYPQILVERIVRQILHLLQRRFSGILKNDLEQEFYELLPTIKSYSDIADLLKSIVSDSYSETEKVGDLGRDIIIKADRYIRDNLNKMITLQNACDYLNISQPYLSRIFRTYKKMSFNEYVTSLRIKKARELFDETPEMLVKDAAEIVGYEDQHYFSKVFKLVVGCSPAEYKMKKYRNN